MIFGRTIWAINKELVVLNWAHRDEKWRCLIKIWYRSVTYEKCFFYNSKKKKKKGQIRCKILPGANLPTIIINAIFVTFCSCMQLWSVLSLLKWFSVFCRSESRIREISATPLQNSAFFLRVLLVLQHLVLTHYKSFTSSKALLINPKRTKPLFSTDFTAFAICL